MAVLAALLVCGPVGTTPARGAPASGAPQLTGISPVAGDVAGGTRVQVTGHGLRGATQVLFGGVPGTGLDVVSDTEVRVTSPPRDVGTVNVRVITSTGRSPGASPVDFRYARPPAVAEVLPGAGAVSGGTLVTIRGADLRETTEVLFGGVPASVVSVSPTHVRVVAPARAGPGQVEVRLVASGGAMSAVSAAPFSYVEVPVLGALSPSSGPTDGGSEVTVRGSHLGDATSVTFGGVEVTSLTVVSDSELRVVTPERHSVGSVVVRVVTTRGSTAERADPVTFSYVVPPPPAVSSTVHSWWPLGLIGMLSWTVWFVRRTLSRHFYQPVVNDFRATTSVVVPVYREDPDVLERCLRTWLREQPTEVILVVDDRDETLLAHVRGLGLDRVQVLEWRHTGKRGAMGAGVRAARGEIVVFADSDTAWRPGLLAAMQMPFADPQVGGVGSRQHVYLPQTDVWRRVAYWMLNTRYLDYVPAMSRRGGVACLSGRTAAYRAEVIRPLMPALEHEVFLGRECVAGDDGRLTWLTLAAGYRTVHQDTAQADSMFPSDLRAFVRQRIRWSRNSYRCYLTALSQGWLWQQPFITQVTVLQVLLTPASMGAAVWYGAHWVIGGGWLAAAVVLGWAVVGRTLRATSHLSENPREIVLAPLVTLVVAGIALPIKAWAALTMNRQGWLTRQEGQRVQGQAEIGAVAHAGQA